MKSNPNTIVAIGLNRLYREVVTSALSAEGWSVLDLQQGRARPDETAEIVLVGCSADAESIVEILRGARNEFPRAKIVLFGVDRSDADLILFIQEGASGYVQCNQGMTDLINTLEMVRNNQTPCSGRITQLVVGSIGRLSREHGGASEASLTLRENEILDLIRHGFSNKEIANKLNIAPATVKNHVHHLLEKLKVHSRHQAAWKQTRGLPCVPATVAARQRN
jgi:two-component system, NarL family, nitrate/nitrite response regulator NarL